MKKLIFILLCTVSISLCFSFRAKNDFRDVKWKAADAQTLVCFNSKNYKYEFYSLYSNKEEVFEFGEWENKGNKIIIKVTVFDTKLKKDTIHLIVYTIKKISRNEMVLYDNQAKKDILFKRN